MHAFFYAQFWGILGKMMAVYSLVELETEIAEAKAAIRRVRRVVSYGTGNVRVECERLKELTGHLQWLHNALRRGHSLDRQAAIGRRLEQCPRTEKPRTKTAIRISLCRKSGTELQAAAVSRLPL